MNAHRQQRRFARELVRQSDSLSRSPRWPRNAVVVFDDARALVEGVQDAARESPRAGRGFVKVRVVASRPLDPVTRQPCGLPSVSGWRPDLDVFAPDFGGGDPEYGCEWPFGAPFVTHQERQRTLDELVRRGFLRLPSDVCGLACESFVRCRLWRTLHAPIRILDWPRRDAFDASITVLTTWPPFEEWTTCRGRVKELAQSARSWFGDDAASIVVRTIRRRVTSLSDVLEVRKVVAQVLRRWGYAKLRTPTHSALSTSVRDVISIIEAAYLGAATGKAPYLIARREAVLPKARRGDAKLVGHTLIPLGVADAWCAKLEPLGASRLDWKKARKILNAVSPKPKRNPAPPFAVGVRAAVADMLTNGKTISIKALAQRMAMTEPALKKALARASLNLGKLQAEFAGQSP